MKQLTLKVTKKLGYVLAACIILLAILVAVSRAVTPILDEHRLEIQQWASETLRTPITIQKVKLSWYQYSPVISLNQVTVLNKQTKKPAIQIDRIHILFSLPKSLFQRQVVPNGIVIRGTDVTLHQANNNEITVEGFPELTPSSTTPATSDLDFTNVIKWIASEPRLILRDIDVRFITKKGAERFVTLYDLHLNNETAEHLITGKAILHQDIPTEINVSVQWTGDPNDLAHVKANAYIYLSGLSLTQWWQGRSWSGWHIKNGMAAIKLWLSWQNQAFHRAQAILTAYDLELFSDTDKTTHKIQRVSGDIGWKEENGIQIIAADDVLIDFPGHLWPSTSFYMELSPDTNGKLYPQKLNVGYLDLQDIQTILISSPLTITPEQKKALTELQVQGSLEKAMLTSTSDAYDLNHLSFATSFSRLAVSPWKAYPGVKNISGDLIWNHGEGKMVLQSTQAEVSLNSIFLQPLQFEELTGNLSISQQDKNWLIALSGLNLQNQDLQLNAGGTVTVTPDLEVSTDLKAKFTIDRAKNITNYLPARYFSKDLTEWLQQAFISGKVKNAFAVLRGPLKDYPFDHGNGEFLINGEVSEVNLRFAPDWPILENITGELNFSGREMVANVSHATTQGVTLHNVHAVIPYLGEDKPQILEISAAPIQTNFRDALQYVHTSPLEKTIGHRFEKAIMQGPVALSLGLTIPLSQPDNTKVNGELSFKDVEMKLEEWGIALGQLAGQVAFTESTTKSQGVTGVLFNRPLQLSLSTVTNKKMNTVRAGINTVFSISDLEAWLKIPFSSMLEGQAAVTGTIDFPGDLPVEVRLSSNLVGVAISNVDSLYKKTATQAKPFTAFITADQKQQLRLQLGYDNTIGAALFLNKQKETFELVAANISLGKGPAAWPKQDGLSITGEIASLDWDKIKTYSSTDKKNKLGSLTLSDVDVVVHQLQLPGQTFSDLRVQLTPSTNSWQLVVNNPVVAGKISLPKKWQPSSTIDAQFQRLHLTTSGVTESNFDIKALPAINFSANSVSVNTISLGQVNFKTVTNSKGLSIKSLTMNLDKTNLQATGEWVQNGARSTSSYQGRVLSTNVSAFLNGLGFDVHNFIASKGTLDFKLSWQGAPFSPAASTLSGEANIDLGKGRIIEVSQTSGAKMDLGRMLSIFSLQTIPRRLSLDFSDLVEKGYSYDTLRGDVSFSNGNAYTSNTKFEGPVARVAINGRIGLVQKDYDLTLSVTPYVTNSIPVAATLLTGQPLVGIAALAVSRVIGSEVSKATTYYYAVRGPWSNPTWDSIKR